MTRLPKIQLGTTARALTAALAIGATVLTFSTGSPAYAIRATSGDPGDTDPGDGMPTRGATGSGTAARNDLCALTRGNGRIDFFTPGTIVSIGDLGKFKCLHNGKWHAIDAVDTSTIDAGSGGVATQAP